MGDDELLSTSAEIYPGDALTQAYDLYATVIFRYVLRLTGNTRDAEDITNETFVRYFGKLCEGRGPDRNLRAYLYQIAYHLVADACRETTRQPMASLDEFNDETFFVHSIFVSDPECDEDIRDVRLAMQSLRPRQRIVLELRFLDGYSVEDTASILHITPKNVSVIQNRAVGAIRRILSR